MNVGAVGALRNIKQAVSVARHVLDHTGHSFLVGSQATDFAVQMGFTKQSLSNKKSKQMWKDWKAKKCQPNFWMVCLFWIDMSPSMAYSMTSCLSSRLQRVTPNPKDSCGPYKPLHSSLEHNEDQMFNRYNHDTIGMVAVDNEGNIAVGTSTNGATHKIPGYV